MFSNAAREFLQCSIQALRNWTDKGHIPHQKNEFGWRTYELKDLEEFKKKIGTDGRMRKA